MCTSPISICTNVITLGLGVSYLISLQTGMCLLVVRLFMDIFFQKDYSPVYSLIDLTQYDFYEVLTG